MFHILLQIDVDTGCQKFMLRSLGGVHFTAADTPSKTDENLKHVVSRAVSQRDMSWAVYTVQLITFTPRRTYSA